MPKKIDTVFDFKITTSKLQTKLFKKQSSPATARKHKYNEIETISILTWHHHLASDSLSILHVNIAGFSVF